MSSLVDLNPPRITVQEPPQEGDWTENQNQPEPHQQPNTAITTTTAPGTVPRLGREFDLANIHSELSSLIDRVDDLILETENVFSQIENIYFNQASPSYLISRLSALYQGYQKLFDALWISGLGALPIKKTDEEIQDVDSLIDALQVGFQALFHERERRRDGSAIVLSILQPNS